jgi:hypothetical protein
VTAPGLCSRGGPCWGARPPSGRGWPARGCHAFRRGPAAEPAARRPGTYGCPEPSRVRPSLVRPLWAPPLTSRPRRSPARALGHLGAWSPLDQVRCPQARLCEPPNRRSALAEGWQLGAWAPGHFLTRRQCGVHRPISAKRRDGEMEVHRYTAGVREDRSTHHPQRPKTSRSTGRGTPCPTEDRQPQTLPLEGPEWIRD